MTPKLTTEQRHELQQQGNKPIPVIDPETNAVYFLVAGEMFERMRAVFENEPFDIRETYPAQSAMAAANGWDDPEMDVYDNDEKNLSQP